MKETSKSHRDSIDLGKYIMADPTVCGGKPTFKGTRIMVFQVLEQVAHGTPWERIIWSWRGKIPLEAITEAVQLASDKFKETVTSNADRGRKRLRERNLAAA